MRAFLHDLRFGFRLLAASPGFTAVAVLTLALGIAATTTVFTWIDGMVLHPFAGVKDDGRLVVLENVFLHGKAEDPNISFDDFRAFGERLTLVSGLALHQSVPASIGLGERSERVWGELVSGNYFGVLGVKAALGRVFAPDEYTLQQGVFAAVISDRLWRGRFHSDPKVLGSTIHVNRQRLTIIGVAAPRFHGVTSGVAFDLWVPLPLRSEADRLSRGYEAIARLRPGATLAQADRELEVVAARLARERPKTNEGRGARLVPVWKAQSGAASLLARPLMILAVAGGLVLLIACANVANLLLARSAARRKEFGIRVALGAGAGRLARQLLTESLVLATLATAAALLVVAWLANSLVWFVPPVSLPLWFDMPLNTRVFAFASLACLGTAVVAGLPPVLPAFRTKVGEVLKQGGRSDSASAEPHRMGGLLVISEVSLAAVALIGAGLFLRSFERLRSLPIGFDPSGVLLSQLYLNTADYTAEQDREFCRRLRTRLEPAAVAVAYADMAPLGFGRPAWDSLVVEGHVPGPGENMSIERTTVSPGYFDLMRIPMIGGRDFTSADTETTAPAMIVNQAFARRFFAGREAVGRRVSRDEGRTWDTIVGVVRDSKYVRVDEGPRPHFFVPFDQAHRGSGNQGVAFLIRTRGNPLGAVRLLRHEMAAVDPQAGAIAAMPLEEYIAASWFGPRLAASLLSVLGAVAILLAAVGLYGVMSYTVSRRTQEIGIRMALGARPADVMVAVVQRGLALTAAGLVIGMAAALAAGRLAAGALVGVSAADPATFAGASLFLAAVAVAACYFPARRATRVDPMRALRD